MRTAMRTTSLEAYGAMVMGPRLGEQQRAILAHLAKHCHTDWTRHEIAKATGIAINAVAGRVNELLGRKVIVELPRRPDRHTGVSAHPIRMAPLQAEMFDA